jgi:hypothetical protein
MFGWKIEKDVKFQRVPSEDSEILDSDPERSSTDARPARAAHNGVSWLGATIMVTITAVVSGSVGAWAAQQVRLDADAFSIRHTAQFCERNAMTTPGRALTRGSSYRRGCSYPL